MELELDSLGIRYTHSTPYHPQTCGKVERLHQTAKRYLAKRSKPTTVFELQTQLEDFVAYYNKVRPPTARSDAAPRRQRSPLGRKQARQGRGLRSLRTSGCAETRSTSPA